MELNVAFGLSLKHLRNHMELTQEDFSDVSSRTYLSTLERGLKSPTIQKLEQLAEILGVHPVTMLISAYAQKDGPNQTQALLRRVSEELHSLNLR